MKRTAPIALSAALLAGCGSWNPWSGPTEQAVIPRDATIYKCDGGRQLVVRYVDGGKSAMVLFPDREFRLDQVPMASGVKYSNGRTDLYTKGDEAFLEEGGQRLYANCTRVQA